MSQSLRNLPRYIRNTDAFGWQGADGPNGPWRSIAPPQSGAPWQTTVPMDDLRQSSAEVSGVEVLSPAAQAVWDAAWQLSPVNCKSHEDRRRQQIAAALRAAAVYSYCPMDRQRLAAIATELEGVNG